MKLLFMLEPGDVLQDGDRFYRASIAEWVHVNIAEPKFAPALKPLDLPTIREVATSDLFDFIKSQYKDGGISDDAIKTGINALGMLCFEGKKDLLKYVADSWDIDVVLEYYKDEEVESFIQSKSTAIDAETGSKGPSFWKNECRELLREVIMKQGWDAVYNRIKDMDFMQPDSGPGLFPETDLTDYSTIKSNYIP